MSDSPANCGLAPDCVPRATARCAAAQAPRRRAPLEPLIADPGAQNLINILTDECLLVTGRGEGGAVVEVAHEALLRIWDRLRLWLDGQVSNLQLRRRLEAEARTWAAADAERKTDYVLLGSRLEEAERSAAAFPAPADVAHFIQASAAHRAKQRAEEERFMGRTSAFGQSMR